MGPVFFKLESVGPPPLSGKGVMKSVVQLVSNSLEDRSVGLIRFFLKLQMKLGVFNGFFFLKKHFLGIPKNNSNVPYNTTETFSDKNLFLQLSPKIFFHFTEFSRHTFNCNFLNEKPIMSIT